MLRGYLPFLPSCPAGTWLCPARQLPSVWGEQWRLPLAGGEMHRGLDSPHLQIFVRLLFPTYTEELTGLATHWLHSRVSEQKQTGVFGSKN